MVALLTQRVKREDLNGGQHYKGIVPGPGRRGNGNTTCCFVLLKLLKVILLLKNQNVQDQGKAMN